jgi:hypothetical protein
MASAWAKRTRTSPTSFLADARDPSKLGRKTIDRGRGPDAGADPSEGWEWPCPPDRKRVSTGWQDSHWIRSYGATVFAHACRLGAEGIVFKRIAPINPACGASGSRPAIPPASPCSGSEARFGLDEPQAARADDDAPQGRNSRSFDQEETAPDGRSQGGARGTAIGAALAAGLRRRELHHRKRGPATGTVRMA